MRHNEVRPGTESPAQDGTYAVSVHAWGTADSPARLSISAVGPVLRTEVREDGCLESYGLNGSTILDVALADAPAPVIADLVLNEQVIQVVCTETAAPGGGSGPSLTLPPTDTRGFPGRPDARPGGVLLLLAGVGLGSLVIVWVRRRA